MHFATLVPGKIPGNRENWITGWPSDRYVAAGNPGKRGKMREMADTKKYTRLRENGVSPLIYRAPRHFSQSRSWFLTSTRASILMDFITQGGRWVFIKFEKGVAKSKTDHVGADSFTGFASWCTPPYRNPGGTELFTHQFEGYIVLVGLKPFPQAVCDFTQYKVLRCLRVAQLAKKPYFCTPIIIKQS